MISLNQITAKRGRFHLSVDKLALKPGELVAVLGNNGSGKSTFLSVLAGFVDYQGEYSLINKSYKAYQNRERNRLVGLLPQKTELTMPFDVFYVILTGRYPLTDGFHYSKQDYTATEAVLKQFDIGHLKKRPFNELSGGEKQRVLLARILNQESPVLLLDEPLNGIDLKHQHETVQHLHNNKKDKTILVVMHDLSLAIREFERFLVFADGQLVYDTPKNDLVAEKLADIFQVAIDFQYQQDKLFVYTAGK